MSTTDVIYLFLGMLAVPIIAWFVIEAVFIIARYRMYRRWH